MPPVTTKPEQLSALFPQAVPAKRGEMSQRMYKARHLRSDTTEAVKQEALRVIDHWNETFRDVRGRGASLAQRAGWNINAYTKFRSACDRSGGMFSYSADDVCRAITAYRKNAANVKLRSWMPFKKWLDVENVDKLIGAARVEQHKADHTANAKADASRRKAKALEVLANLNIVRHAEIAARANSTLDAMCQKTQSKSKETRNTKAHDWCAKIRGLIATMRAFPKARQDSYTRRAEEVYVCAYGKPSGAHPMGRVRIEAIRLSLLDYDIRRNQRNNPKEAKGVPA